MSVIIALVPIELMDFIKVSLSSTAMIYLVIIMTIFTALQRVHWEVYNSYIDQDYMFLVQIKGHKMRWRK